MQTMKWKVKTDQIQQQYKKQGLIKYVTVTIKNN